MYTLYIHNVIRGVYGISKAPAELNTTLNGDKEPKTEIVKPLQRGVSVQNPACPSMGNISHSIRSKFMYSTNGCMYTQKLRTGVKSVCKIMIPLP